MKNIKQIAFYVILIIVGLLQSCAPVYTPNVVNTPLFTEKGESQVNAAVATSRNGSKSAFSFEPQLAFALTNHVGIIVNGSYQNTQDDTLTSAKERHKHIFAEAGIGYYYPIGEKYRLEIFGGIGQGTVWARFENSFVDKNAKANYTRYFLQPNVGICQDIFEISFSPRLSLVDMQLYDQEMAAFNTTGIDFFIEPTITAKVGYKFIKVFFQTGFCIPLTEDVEYNHTPFFFSVGLHGKLIPRKDKEIPTE